MAAAIVAASYCKDGFYEIIKCSESVNIAAEEATPSAQQMRQVGTV